MSKALTVHNAEIKTAAVEIRTLTVSGKQVTLAVFRQLRKEPLIARDGALNGVPWGVVNYHPDKCGGESEHLHVVWQRGTELLRSHVTVAPVWKRFWPRIGPAFISSHVRELAMGMASPYFGGGFPEVEWNGRHRVVTWSVTDGIQIGAKPTPNASTAIQICCDYAEAEREAGGDPHRYVTFWDAQHLRSCRTWKSAKSELEEMRADVLTALDQELGPRESAQGLTERLGRKLAAEVEEEQERRNRHMQQRTLIAALPQLFIAV